MQMLSYFSSDAEPKLDCETDRVVTRRVQPALVEQQRIGDLPERGAIVLARLRAIEGLSTTLIHQ